MCFGWFFALGLADGTSLGSFVGTNVGYNDCVSVGAKDKTLGGFNDGAFDGE